MGALSSPNHPIALNIVDSKGSCEMPKASDLLLQTVHQNKNKGDIDIPEEDIPEERRRLRQKKYDYDEEHLKLDDLSALLV